MVMSSAYVVMWMSRGGVGRSVEEPPGNLKYQRIVCSRTTWQLTIPENSQ